MFDRGGHAHAAAGGDDQLGVRFLDGEKGRRRFVKIDPLGEGIGLGRDLQREVLQLLPAQRARPQVRDVVRNRNVGFVGVGGAVGDGVEHGDGKPES